MSEEVSSPSTNRLLAATLAAHDAFSEAARTVVATGYAAEFAQRAEYQWRIATHLRGHQTPEGLATDALRRLPDVRSHGSTSSVTDDESRALFDKCLRLMDLATVEFCRGYGPGVALVLSRAMQLAYPIDTTWHGAGTSGSTARVSITSSTVQRARPRHTE
jgi:hypothetical protein